MCLLDRHCRFINISFEQSRFYIYSQWWFSLFLVLANVILYEDFCDNTLDYVSLYLIQTLTAITQHTQYIILRQQRHRFLPYFYNFYGQFIQVFEVQIFSKILSHRNQVVKRSNCTLILIFLGQLDVMMNGVITDGIGRVLVDQYICSQIILHTQQVQLVACPCWQLHSSSLDWWNIACLIKVILYYVKKKKKKKKIGRAHV
eukprot:TRINITY_DN4885_c0_g1_i2.p3 TRINITY_DN4885_c0_g1~~TRINITY_DN4885_c0_g1_i2.p3  ORF type:complete len:202 (+),score=-6.17 TRINITY_DN4885_c0_g1_i2:1446-2051(+)